ncbi:hypothetical protein [Chryseobacterium sp. CT-SW4]|uniref:hypothetical protein n=1 Tax=Chryseobacterium sp. SW-1 TaxID=3157343 RepID=UPI003B021EA6
MKNIYQSSVFIITLLVFVLLFSCESGSDENDFPIIQDNNTLVKIQDITNEKYTISLFNSTGKLSTGYNEIYLQIKNKATGEIVTNGDLTWHPEMSMMTMMHSCPHSEIEKLTGQNLYKGFIIFQMAGNDSERWKLTLDLTVDGQIDQLEDFIEVNAAAKRNVEVFTGADNLRYILAMTAPSSPKIGINDITAYLFQMVDMHTFIPVDGYTVKLDPRMPGMGNHSSPNNSDLIFNSVTGLYQGKVSLTMTGYWKLNLMVLDPSGNLLKGETVTGTQESSSLFFEIEF